MHCKKLKSIELPPLVTSISDKTFAHCCALEHIDLRHISFIGESAFVGCNSLGDVAISDALKEVHAASFCGSKYYTHRLKRKDGVVYLGKWVIGCPGLTREYVINRGTVGIARDIFANERHIKHTINPQYDDEMKHFLIALEMPLVPYMGLPQAYFEEVVPASIHYEGTIAEWKKIIKLPGKKRIPAHVVAEDGTIDTYL